MIYALAARRAFPLGVYPEQNCGKRPEEYPADAQRRAVLRYLSPTFTSVSSSSTSISVNGNFGTRIAV